MVDDATSSVVRAAAASLAASLRRQMELGVRGIGVGDAARLVEQLERIDTALTASPVVPATTPAASAPARTAPTAPVMPAPSADRRSSPRTPSPAANTHTPVVAPPPATNLPWVPATATSTTHTAPPAPAQPRPAATSVDPLRAVREELGDCQRCGLCAGRTQIVFGVGSPSARVMFVGEAPGHEEDLRGEPFVGAAGQLLTRMIEAMTLSRERVYIANVVKCRPPGNRDPNADEVASCLPFLRAQIDAIRPEVLVTLGKHSFHALSGQTAGITASRGRFFDYRGTPVMPTFHPAYVLRLAGDEQRDAKKKVWDDLQAVMKKLGIEPARRSS